MVEYSNEGIGKLKSVLKLSFIYKGLNIMLSFLLVRFTIQYAGDEIYGLWVTILAFLTWFSVIESGVSNSFRNKITSYFSEKNYDKIKLQIAMAYKSLSIIYIVLALLIVAVIYTTSFHTLFQSDNFMNSRAALAISVSIYFLYFIFHYLNSVFLAIHKAEKTYLFLLFQNAVVLLVLILLNYSSIEASLNLICIIYTLGPLITWILLNAVSFKKILNKLQPSYHHFQQSGNIFEKLNPSFFILQLFTLLIYSTDNIIILNFLNGSEVAKYNVAFKYFNIITVLFNLILVPYWAIFSEAFYKKDKSSIVYSINRLLRNWGALLLVSILLVIISPFAYSFWIGKTMNISITLSILMAVSAILTSWFNIFAYYLKSSNQLRLQTRLLIFAGISNIPLSIFLIQFFESEGVILATILSILPLVFALPWQYKKSINNLV
ncbi:MAG: polysaccharide biosynthesis C-terminal domain-containing protein [Vicingaceae bacterium]